MKAKLLALLLVVLVLGSAIVSYAAGTATLTVNKAKYTVGEDVTVTFKDATGDNNAWIAIYPEGKAYEEYAGTEKDWAYANSNTETAGAAAAAEGSVTLQTANLAPGKYNCTYFPDISYTVGSTITFDIAEASNPTTGDSVALMATVTILAVAVVVLKRRSVKA